MTGEESGSPPAGSRNPGRCSDRERVDTAGLSGWPVGRGRSLCLCQEPPRSWHSPHIRRSQEGPDSGFAVQRGVTSRAAS